MKFDKKILLILILVKVALALAFVFFNSEPSYDPWWSCRPRQFLSLFGL